MSDEPIKAREFDEFKKTVYDRFGTLERYLERIALSVEKAAENRERTLVVEAKLDAAVTQMITLAENMNTLKNEMDKLKTNQTRILAYGGLLGTIAVIGIPLAITYILSGGGTS